MNKKSQFFFFFFLLISIFLFMGCSQNNSMIRKNLKTSYAPSASHYSNKETSSSDSFSKKSSAPRSQSSSSMIGSYRRGRVVHPTHRYKSGSYIRRYQRTYRPGLGTAYGESLYSPVSNVQFYRSSIRPISILSINYNNLSGIRAMARYLHTRSCCQRSPYLYGGGVSVSIVNRYGQALKGVKMRGRTFVIGRHHTRYQIFIRNHTSQRREIVVSVDGLDVIDGRPANLNKRGYVILPHRYLRINGFRRSDTHVAAFRFSSVRRSYAGLTSGSRNVGVIGIAVFAERQAFWNSNDLRKRLRAHPFQY